MLQTVFDSCFASFISRLRVGLNRELQAFDESLAYLRTTQTAERWLFEVVARARKACHNRQGCSAEDISVLEPAQPLHLT